ncbi:hypothetical protein KSF_005310 [Reticulibacter mediterranei]|uniref:Integrase catalytic domain-containing protein n=1 Tax=Reticulibacter mediterranei TaxID=2778369 RepID=A0A8J3IBB3_9CHLR|nr:hypothetical protein KSF_005310 [Reticulibacter mediterranei]
MKSGWAILLLVFTYEGWLYLAVVLDLFSRRVVGWAMAANQDEWLRRRCLVGVQELGYSFILIEDRNI